MSKEHNGLASGWVTASLGDCAVRITDGTHLPPQFEVSGIPFLFVKHIVGGQITFEGTKFISEETFAELDGRCSVEFGDILYSAVGSYGVAVPVLTDRKFSFQRHIAHIKPHKQLDQKYLTYCLNSPFCLSQAHRLARGVAQKTVTLGDLKRFCMPIAPINEQRRIVAKIEELFSDLDAGVAALERVRANLKRYRAAVLKAAVEGTLIELRHHQFEKSNWLEIGSVLTCVEQGWSPKCERVPASDHNEWAVMKTSAVMPMQFLEEENKRRNRSAEFGSICSLAELVGCPHGSGDLSGMPGA